MASLGGKEGYGGRLLFGRRSEIGAVPGGEGTWHLGAARRSAWYRVRRALGIWAPLGDRRGTGKMGKMFGEGKLMGRDNGLVFEGFGLWIIFEGWP